MKTYTYRLKIGDRLFIGQTEAVSMKHAINQVSQLPEVKASVKPINTLIYASR